MWRKHRKLIHERFTISACPSYESLQIQEVNILLKNLLSRPTEFRGLIRRFSTAIVMDIAYGHQIVSDDDEYIKFAEQSTNALESAGQLSASLLDFFPILTHIPESLRQIPGLSWIFEAIRIHKPFLEHMKVSTVDTVQQQMAAGVARPSFVSSHLENMHREGANSNLTLQDIQGAAQVMFVGATETTWTTMLAFFWVMAKNPEVKRKAQQELDRVVGIGRLPDFRDRASMPYLECVLEETLRFHPAVIIGVPHSTVEDDMYKGMFIPKGSTVIANIWAMCHDENVYKRPDEFYPERFLPQPLGYGERRLNGMNFGFGRRICPGRRLAETSIWIAIVSALAVFDITEAEGETVNADFLYSSSLIAVPLPFQCKITPRSSRAEVLVRQTDY